MVPILEILEWSLFCRMWVSSSGSTAWNTLEKQHQLFHEKPKQREKWNQTILRINNHYQLWPILFKNSFSRNKTVSVFLSGLDPFSRTLFTGARLRRMNKISSLLDIHDKVSSYIEIQMHRNRTYLDAKSLVW